jgi:HAMP domain-containing protein
LLSLGAGLLILLVDIVLLGRSNDMVAVPMILPMTILMVVVSICVLVAVMPPFAVFSYIAMRRTVYRLKLLAVATSSLRNGNYGVRVPVEGEDEVAQLQSWKMKRSACKGWLRTSSRSRAPKLVGSNGICRKRARRWELLYGSFACIVCHAASPVLSHSSFAQRMRTSL